MRAIPGARRLVSAGLTGLAGTACLAVARSRCCWPLVCSGRPYRALRRPLFEVGVMLEAAAIHPGRSARKHLLASAHSNGIGRRRVDEVLGLVGRMRWLAGGPAGSPWA